MREPDDFQSNFRHLFKEWDYGEASARATKIPLAYSYSAAQGTIVNHGLE